MSQAIILKTQSITVNNQTAVIFISGSEISKLKRKAYVRYFDFVGGVLEDSEEVLPDLLRQVQSYCRKEDITLWSY